MCECGGKFQAIEHLRECPHMEELCTKEDLAKSTDQAIIYNNIHPFLDSNLNVVIGYEKNKKN